MQSFHSQLELHGLHGMVMKAHHDDNNNSSGGAGTKDLLQHPALQQHHPHLAHQAAHHHHSLHSDSNSNSPVVVDVLPPAYTSPASAPGASPPSYHLAASRHQDSDSASKASKAGLGGSSSSGEESKGERALYLLYRSNRGPGQFTMYAGVVLISRNRGGDCSGIAYF